VKSLAIINTHHWSFSLSCPPFCSHSPTTFMIGINARTFRQFPHTPVHVTAVITSSRHHAVVRRCSWRFQRNEIVPIKACARIHDLRWVFFPCSILFHFECQARKQHVQSLVFGPTRAGFESPTRQTRSGCWKHQKDTDDVRLPCEGFRYFHPKCV